MDTYLRNRIENITEGDFWSSIKPLPELSAAIEAGKAGRRAGAYKLLGRYHANTLACERDLLEKNARDACKDRATAARLRRSAGMTLRHEIRGPSGKITRFGPRIDFNADFGQSGQYWFHYLDWMNPVVTAYASTGQEKYRRCLLDVLRQYYHQRNKLVWRIYDLHPVYYELGSWAKTGVILPAYALLAGHKAMAVGDYESMLKLLLGFARSLHRIQKKGYARGNWQIVGANALYWLGCAFSEFRESARWRRVAQENILQHAKKDFLSDGGHSERCWGYGWMSLKGMLEFYRVGLRHNRLRGEALGVMENCLRKAFQWFARTVSPTQELLNYGDGHIGSVKGILAEARETFPDIDEGPGLLGVDRSRSCILRPSGYAFMRDGDGAQSPYMSVNFGKWGGWHTHNDLLDFSLWCFGRPLIEEVGRFGMYDIPLNPFFRSEQAHNQIVIEHFPMNREKHKGRDVVWHCTDRADFFSAYHLAYTPKGKNSMRIKVHRSIVFVKPERPGGAPAYWVIHDVVSAREYHFQASSYLHAIRPFRIIRNGLARVEGKRSCLVAFAEAPSIRRFLTAVDYSPADTAGLGRGWHGRAAQRHRLVATKWNDIGDNRPITFTMLLMPFEGAKPPDVSLRPVSAKADDGEHAAAFAVGIQGRKDTIAFNPGESEDFRVGRKKLAGPMAAKIGRRWIECPG